MGFVRATKAYILPTVFDDVYRFRKAFLTLDSVLRTLFSAISASGGTAEAVSTLRGNYNDGLVDCQGLQPTGYSSGCPWGLLSFIQSAGLSLGVDGSFSEAEVRRVCVLHLYCSGTRATLPGSVYPDCSGGVLIDVPVTILDSLADLGP